VLVAALEPINIQALRKKGRRAMRIICLCFAAFFALNGTLLALVIARDSVQRGSLLAFFITLISPLMLLVSGLPLFVFLLRFYGGRGKGKRLMASYGVDEQAEQSYEREAASGRAVVFGTAVLTDNWVFDRDWLSWAAWFDCTLALMPLREIVGVRKRWHGRYNIRSFAVLRYGNGQQQKIGIGSKADIDQFIEELQRRCPWIQFD